MKKKARCCSGRRRTRGDAMVEALISVLLMAVLGLGLSYAGAQIFRNQRYANAQGVVLNQIRGALQTQGLPALCGAGGTATVSAGGSAQSLVLTSSGCSRAPVSVSVTGFGNVALGATLPAGVITTMTLSTPANSELIGDGAIMVTQ